MAHSNEQHTGASVHKAGIPVHESVDVLFDVATAARYAAVSRVWLYRNYARIPHIRLGNGPRPMIRFRRSDLDRWIAQHRIAPKGL